MIVKKNPINDKSQTGGQRVGLEMHAGSLIYDSCFSSDDIDPKWGSLTRLDVDY